MVSVTVTDLTLPFAFWTSIAPKNKFFKMTQADRPLIVVLGLGEMGLIHARNLAKLRRIRLGLASTRSDHLTSISEELHPEFTFTSYSDAISDPNVDAVVIATSVDTHPSYIEQCAFAGKHIFTEKPLGNDLESVLKALNVVQEKGVKFMVGFQRRFDPPYIAAADRIEDSSLGQPIVLKCTSGDPDYPIKYVRGALPYAAFYDLAVHDIDLARWLTESEVKSVYATGSALVYPQLNDVPDYDNATVLMKMQNDAQVMIHLSRALSYGYNVSSELTCEKGTMKMGELSHSDMTALVDGVEGKKITWGFGERFEKAFENEMKAWVNVVLGEKSEKWMRVAGMKDGLMATVVAEALVKSAKTGMVQDVLYKEEYGKY